MRLGPRGWSAARRHGLTVLSGAASLLAACGAGPSRTPAPPLRVGLYAAPLSLDPHLENEFLTSGILANAFEGLTSLDAAMRAEPALAVSWDTPSPRTWRFRLRPGVRFQDGYPVGAADVVWSLDRARRHPRSGVAHYLADVVAVQALAADVVEIRTQASTSLLLNRLAFIAIVPRSSPDEIRTPVGTGPYRLEPANLPRELTLRRSDVYWGRRPPEPIVRLRVVPDQGRTRAMLLAGELDVALNLAPEEADRMRSEACCRVVAQPAVTVETLLFRVDRPPFRDLRVRRALHLALDRPALAERNLMGWGEPASQLASPWVVGFAPRLRAPARDVSEARRLLAEAGYPRGLSSTLVYREDRRGDEIRRQLAEAGMAVTLRPRPWGEVLGRLRSGEAHLYYVAFIADTGDAGDILDSAIHTPDPAAGLGVDNHSGYSSPEVDRLLDEARAAPTLLDRRQALQTAMERIMVDLPMVPLVVPDDLYVLRRGIAWTPRLDGRILAADLVREPGTLPRGRR
ncbi:MAG TPA: ABC transporter substrate-binding protein [Vicinamibacteria bacterium]|nr:ABC transporter substrate-binding protein [Vicinamibacteria bacterium]